MSEFEFGKLSYSYLFIVLGVFFFFTSRFQKTLLKNFKDFFYNKDSVDKKYFNKVQFSGKRISFVSIALLFLTIGILQPKWGYKEIKTSKQGRDIAIAVDVSESMLARDVEPNRLTRAKREIIDLIENLRGDRIALVSFAGSAIVEVPLTSDYKAFKSFLDVLDPNFSPIKGSNIKVALETSIELLTRVSGKKSSKDKAVILITDGEDTDDSYEKVKKLAKESSTSIYVIGVGTEKGAELKTSKGFKRDNSGNIIISKLKVNELRELAKKTGGQYVVSVNSDKDIISIYNNGIRQKLNKKDYKSNNQKIWNQYFQLPLLLAILFLFYSWNNISRNTKVKLILFLLVFKPELSFSEVDNKVSSEINSELSSEVNREVNNKTNKAKSKFKNGDYLESKNIFSSFSNKDENTLLGIGANNYRLGEFIEAFKNFAEASKIAKNKKNKEYALYNAANSLVQLEKYKGAIALYKEALKINTNDIETKENLEYVKKLLNSSSSQQNSSKSSSDNSSSSSSSSSDSSQSSSQDSSGQSSQQSSENSSSKESDSSEQNSSGQSSSEQSSSGQSSSQNSSSSDGASQEDSSSSSSSQNSEEDTQKESEENSTQAGSSSSENSDSQQIISQIYNVDESFVANNTYRYRKSVEQLKKLNAQAPKNDW